MAFGYRYRYLSLDSSTYRSSSWRNVAIYPRCGHNFPCHSSCSKSARLFHYSRESISFFARLSFDVPFSLDSHASLFGGFPTSRKRTAFAKLRSFSVGRPTDRQAGRPVSQSLSSSQYRTQSVEISDRSSTELSLERGKASRVRRLRMLEVSHSWEVRFGNRRLGRPRIGRARPHFEAGHISFSFPILLYTPCCSRLRASSRRADGVREREACRFGGRGDATGST